jgi:hypothetical protein
MKLNPQGTTVLYSTYLGGSADDEGLAITVDSSGQALVPGYHRLNQLPDRQPVSGDQAAVPETVSLRA